jgi:hypothetical protein
MSGTSSRLRVARRRSIAFLAAAAAVAAGLAASASAQTSVVAATWDVLGVGPHGRSLELVYITGGCLSPTAQTAVAETAASVTITVTLADRQGPGVACPDYLRYATSSVALAAPLAGRVILGRPSPPLRGYPGDLVSSGGGLEVRMPRLVGFSPADARHTLALYGLGEHVLAGPRRHGLVRVSAQAPQPGALVHQRATVTVRVSRPLP